MNDRVFMLLDVKNGKSEQLISSIKDKAGIAIAEMLDGPPDVILMVEAPNRQELADKAIHAISLVENMIDNIRLLPALTKPKAYVD
jgi:hypothetical protein